MQVTRAKFVENMLDVKLPKDYASFLNESGDYCNDGFEVYGYTESYSDINKIPCVVGATNIYRDSYQLSLTEIVIAHSGFEDLVIILDTANGCVYEVNLVGDRKKLSDSFDAWFSEAKNVL